MSIAVYPGTFDPITLGHHDIAMRAATLFDKVILAIAHNPKKVPVFSLDERVAMAQSAFSNSPKVEIQAFDTLLVHFAQQQQAKVIIRGLRAVSDFDYEFQLAGMNRKLDPQIETVFLTPSEQYTYISSSLVREISAMGGNVSNFVNREVEAALHQRLR
ncbi:MAG: pantetheine-phosphate adenylyltransferase [Gammaproteobacteria bacterium]|nr:pantetheine-phosphate adenylyltransferase [Gammaproteobacteria bacterium]MCF6229432.1 pantetheine-phosphate adenylyltransferase [Gammaproteobacteria bacterium]